MIENFNDFEYAVEEQYRKLSSTENVEYNSSLYAEAFILIYNKLNIRRS